MNKRFLSSRGGSVMVVLVLFIVLASFAIPPLVRLARQESESIVRLKKQTVALKMASVGVEKSIWKLKETMSYWDNLVETGQPPAGYNNDQIFQDVDSNDGFYRVRISSVTGDPHQLLIVSTGKDSRSHEFRTVSTVVKRTRVLAPLQGYNIGKGATPFQINAQWGPIISSGELVLSSADLNQLYPRKFSATQLTSTAGVYARSDTSPDSPNSSSDFFDADWPEYHTYYKIPPFPEPDLDFYRSSAAALGNYWTNNRTFGNGTIDAAPTVRFIDGANGTITQPNSFLQGHLFVLGNLSIQGNRTADLGPNNYNPVIPPDAWQQYTTNTPSRRDNTTRTTTPASPLAGEYGPDSPTANEYPGDAGNRTVSSSLQWTSCGTCQAGGRYPAFKGIIYVTGTLSGGAANPQVIHGALLMPSGATHGAGWFEVFFDHTVELRTATASIYTEQWMEISAQSF